MKRSLRSISGILGASLLISLAGDCPAQEKAKEIIGRLNGEPIYLSDVEEAIAFQVYRLQSDIYQLLKTETEEIVNQRLLEQEAALRGLTVEDLLRMEVDEKTPLVDEGQVEAYLTEHPKDGGGGPGQRDRIRTYLVERARIQRRLDFLAILRQKSDFTFLLEPPERPRIPLRLEGQPWRGSPEGPVTIVHFSSFTCDPCFQSVARIRRLFEDFPGRIKWVHRNFFSMYDEKALAAAEMAESAHEQNKFWSFHDRLYAQAGDFDLAELADIAATIGMSQKQYEEGQRAGRYLVEVRRDIGDAARIGVTGVPVIFVNGIYFSGTLPYEELRAIVQKELDGAQ